MDGLNCWAGARRARVDFEFVATFTCTVFTFIIRCLDFIIATKTKTAAPYTLSFLYIKNSLTALYLPLCLILDKHLFQQAMSSTKLDQLRATLASLHSFELPNRFSQDPVAEVLSEEMLERYQRARDEYIHRRMLQVFYDHIATFNGEEFDLPPLPSDSEVSSLNEKRRDVQDALMRNSANVNQRNLELQGKYNAFSMRREELRKMIRDIEEKPMSQESFDDDEDDVIDQEQFTYQGQHLADVTQRKTELEMELERIRHEKALAAKTLEDTKNQVDELQKSRGVVKAVTPESLAELESESAKVRSKAAEFKEMSEWYSGIVEVMEEIGGIKLLSVVDGEDDEIAVQVELLGKHRVQISMANRGDEFHVTGASFVTSTLVTSLDSQDDATSQSSLQLNIPPLDDLVRLCANLGTGEDLRFLLRETLQRIRAITARVDELAILRTLHLTKIGKLNYHQDFSFGGEDQEIVCSLNECITAIIRLTPDCPLEEGSARLDQVVGLGGWSPEVLERLEHNVNTVNCKGPLAIMEALVDELRHLEKAGLKIPTTPHLPSRKTN